MGFYEVLNSPEFSDQRSFKSAKISCNDLEKFHKPGWCKQLMPVAGEWVVGGTFRNPFTFFARQQGLLCGRWGQRPPGCLRKEEPLGRRRSPLCPAETAALCHLPNTEMVSRRPWSSSAEAAASRSRDFHLVTSPGVSTPVIRPHPTVPLGLALVCLRLDNDRRKIIVMSHIHRLPSFDLLAAISLRISSRFSGSQTRSSGEYTCETVVYSANYSRTRQQNVRTIPANQRVVTYSPAGSAAKKEPFLHAVANQTRGPPPESHAANQRTSTPTSKEPRSHFASVYFSTLSAHRSAAYSDGHLNKCFAHWTTPARLPFLTRVLSGEESPTRRAAANGAHSYVNTDRGCGEVLDWQPCECRVRCVTRRATRPREGAQHIRHSRHARPITIPWLSPGMSGGSGGGGGGRVVRIAARRWLSLSHAVHNRFTRRGPRAASIDRHPNRDSIHRMPPGHALNLEKGQPWCMGQTARLPPRRTGFHSRRGRPAEFSRVGIVPDDAPRKVHRVCGITFSLPRIRSKGTDAPLSVTFNQGNERRPLRVPFTVGRVKEVHTIPHGRLGTGASLQFRMTTCTGVQPPSSRQLRTERPRQGRPVLALRRAGIFELIITRQFPTECVSSPVIIILPPCLPVSAQLRRKRRCCLLGDTLRHYNFDNPIETIGVLFFHWVYDDYNARMDLSWHHACAGGGGFPLRRRFSSEPDTSHVTKKTCSSARGPLALGTEEGLHTKRKKKEDAELKNLLMKS
ncbi:hypothetical protein PR048_017578 [Dryococelus australis]|uniref:Uncharacterized protein n=1 Tax=Dryococelus australis TaxID=614101 RepID=A0ABQ9H9Z6_9NEOP|nr:hypothetical protein PR048_017578 [Dryococelus australis]